MEVLAAQAGVAPFAEELEARLKNGAWDPILKCACAGCKRGYVEL